MSKRDYYEVLGLNKQANENDIKKAYRKKAIEYHPDKNPGDKASEEKFKEVSEAYEVLKDPQKRQAYDQFGHSAFKGGQSSSAGGFGGFEGFDFEDIFGDVFGSFFGGGNRNSSKNRRSSNANAQVKITINLREAFTGVSKTIRFQRKEACDSCQGTGGARNSSKQTCPRCNGRGSITFSNGFFTQREVCSQCGGSGSTISNPCRTCEGSGLKYAYRDLSINIPKGVDTGVILNVTGEGHFVNSSRGDLLLQIVVQDVEGFRRDENQLHVLVKIDYPTLILGGSISFTNLDHKEINLRIPSMTTLDKSFKLKGQGFPALNSPYSGDLFVHLELKYPKKLSTSAKTKLEEFQALL